MMQIKIKQCPLLSIPFFRGNPAGMGGQEESCLRKGEFS